jgi:ankyrin repeat protein
MARRSPSILHLASRGELESLRAALEGDPSCVDERDERLQTGLLLAAQEGHVEVVRLLLTNGAECECCPPPPWCHQRVTRLSPNRAFPTVGDAKSCDAMRALHRSAINGHAEVVKLLLTSGADMNAEVKA